MARELLKNKTKQHDYNKFCTWSWVNSLSTQWSSISFNYVLVSGRIYSYTGYYFFSGSKASLILSVLKPIGNFHKLEEKETLLYMQK